MTSADQQNVERSVPKPEFTDAEAGAKVFPDSTARHYNYFIPQKRKQPTTRTSPSRSSPTRGTTSPRAGSTASPTAAAATRWTGPR